MVYFDVCVHEVSVAARTSRQLLFSVEPFKIVNAPITTNILLRIEIRNNGGNQKVNPLNVIFRTVPNFLEDLIDIHGGHINKIFTTY